MFNEYIGLSANIVSEFIHLTCGITTFLLLLRILLHILNCVPLLVRLALTTGQTNSSGITSPLLPFTSILVINNSHQRYANLYSTFAKNGIYKVGCICTNLDKLSSEFSEIFNQTQWDIILTSIT